MANKPTEPDRTAVIEELHGKQKAAERRRAVILVGVCSLVAIAIVGAAAYHRSGDDETVRDLGKRPIESIGSTASTCSAITTTATDGSHEHEVVGSQIVYSTAPPAFGPHWSEPGVAPAPFNRKFYTEQDRPELEALVHNLEHGYTILWYDDTIAGDADQLDVVKGIANKYAGDNNLRHKFIAAPWTAADEQESGTFPDGMHVAFSHWSAGGFGGTDVSKEAGVFQYCGQPSGEALEDFMMEYSYADSPEPDAM